MREIGGEGYGPESQTQASIVKDWKTTDSLGKRFVENKHPVTYEELFKEFSSADL